MPSPPNLRATLAKPGAAVEEVEEDDEEEEVELEEEEEKALSIVWLTAFLITSTMATVTPTMKSKVMTQTIVERLAGRLKVCGSKACP
jgi:hypothetical protein